MPNMVRQSQLTDQWRDRWRLPWGDGYVHFDVRPPSQDSVRGSLRPTRSDVSVEASSPILITFEH